MPAPFGPNTVKETVPSVTGNFCERFLKALTLPKLVHQIVSWMITEDGEINPDGMGADICALTCFGGQGQQGGTGTTFGYPQNVVASDGLFTDRVRITWNAVFSATAYDVYRNTVNNTSTATMIGTTANLSFDDTTADPAVNYYYWVRARSLTQTSLYSLPDQGYRAQILVAVSDLTATKGFSRATNPFISLIFTPIPTATAYDFYISDTNDFNDAVLLDSARTPFDNSESLNLCSPTPCTSPVFIDNSGELVYVYVPTVIADFYNKKYFWVIGKKMNDGMVTAISGSSNSAEGWAVGFGTGVPNAGDEVIESGDTVDVPAGLAEAWAVLYGSGAGGAGGDGDNGGGGGGGAAVLIGRFSVAVGSKLRVVSTPEADTGNAASGTSGSDGPVTKLQYSANGLFTDTVDLMTALAAGGGQFVDGANGAGGVGATGVGHGSLSDSAVYDGRDGLPANGTKGGRGGQRYGGLRRQGAHWNGFLVGSDTGDGATMGAGGGCYANPTVPALATGGKGIRGFAYVSYRI